MEYTICPRGHYYYPAVNPSCPVCEADNREKTATETIFTNFTEQFGGMTENIPPNGFENGIGMTESLPSDMEVGLPLYEGTAPFNAGDYTTPLDADLNGGFTYTTPIIDDYDVTRPVMQCGDPDFTPVVGWLVAVSGSAKGADFKIRSGYNYIGRDNNMDICIPGDMELSRQKAAVIGFDPVEKLFLFAPSEGKNFVRINGKAIIGPTVIKSFDRLRIGSTDLIFVAFCGERFGWDE